MTRPAPDAQYAPRAPTAPPALSENQQHDARYLALCARDARFDGQFFTGVSSTGVYCRPVCAVRTPRRENCRFFDLAAQAEQAGFRPCLRCRPEVAPGRLLWSSQDATSLLLSEALRLLTSDRAGAPASSPMAPQACIAPIAQVAARLGVSDRHLRRIFESRLGITPLQYLQTQRLLTAKHLLTDTAMSATDVALASGFGSVRRFNAAFSRHYRLSPTALRRVRPLDRASRADGSAVALRLAYRPPLDADALLNFFGSRSVAGVEMLDTSGAQAVYRRTVCVGVPGRSDGVSENTAAQSIACGWIALAFHPSRSEVQLQASDSLAPHLALVMRRVRDLLDLDADPHAINAVLHADFPKGDGLRVPGAWDGFETAVRAVLGQQISVAAARTLASRLVARFGEPVATPWPALNRLFPTAICLAAVSPDELGRLGIVRQRQAAITALARAVLSGQLQLNAGADVARTTEQLCALPGIGDWTAQYIAMRVLRWPDAFPSGDVALQAALGVRQQPRPARAALDASAAWQPWRSYAVVRAWAQGSRAAPTQAQHGIKAPP